MSIKIRAAGMRQIDSGKSEALVDSGLHDEKELFCALMVADSKALLVEAKPHLMMQVAALLQLMVDSLQSPSTSMMHVSVDVDGKQTSKVVDCP
eukprot:CAMPEP_0197034234 /NCGR_PEP_ID=MMETSP1384-20130603/12406_1 /TAXON_ID=29189 /ORGANISM="Ammonia sp." /LENGTH=93 /DNA_ID=CAMNT_0042464137 /DNA_START=136 /DNA_END=414 /DNA_ORIENTATION=-